MEIFSLFPSVIHRLDPPSDFKYIKDDLINFVYKERKRDPKGRRVSNVGGWQSEDFRSKGDPITSYIVDNITPHFTNIMNSWVEVIMLNSWININNKGNSNSMHLHMRCDLAGVFYLKVPKNSGRLKFVSPHDYLYYGERECYKEEFKNSLSHYSDCSREPTEGEIYIFPSSLYHEVTPSESRQDRISVGFNIKLGDKRFPNW